MYKLARNILCVLSLSFSDNLIDYSTTRLITLITLTGSLCLFLEYNSAASSLDGTKSGNFFHRQRERSILKVSAFVAAVAAAVAS